MTAVVVVAILLLAGCAAVGDRAQLTRQGETTFSVQGCYGCHTVGKTGTPIATDLTRIGARYSESHLRSWLADPDAQKPTAHMPKLALTDAEVKSLAAYLASLR
jgi:cytochrome c1